MYWVEVDDGKFYNITKFVTFFINASGVGVAYDIDGERYEIKEEYSEKIKNAIADHIMRQGYSDIDQSVKIWGTGE